MNALAVVPSMNSPYCASVETVRDLEKNRSTPYVEIIWALRVELLGSCAIILRAFAPYPRMNVEPSNASFFPVRSFQFLTMCTRLSPVCLVGASPGTDEGTSLTPIMPTP